MVSVGRAVAVEALEVTAAALNMVVAVAVVHAQTLHKRAWVVVALVLAVLVAVVVECQMVSLVARVARQDLTQQAAAQQGGQVLQGLRAWSVWPARPGSALPLLLARWRLLQRQARRCYQRLRTPRSACSDR